MANKNLESSYQRWMRDEGLPVHSGYGITDVGTVELGAWPRLGGRGAFIQLVGMEGYTGMYVGEIPPGGALESEKHLFEELIYIIDGNGAAEVWSGARDQPPSQKTIFEWQRGALFASPLNTWHRLLNGSGTKPVRFLAATNAPLVIDLYHSPEFVFNCDYAFTDRFQGESDYFKVGERRDRTDIVGKLWETNFIPDVIGASVDAQPLKGKAVNVTAYQMAGNILVGHLTEWPVGRYHKCHYHLGGAILLIMRSVGYTLMWPKDAGIHPYEDGHADQVVKVDWQVGSVFCPPTGWYHQHFNAGAEPAKQLALRYGSVKYGVGFHDLASNEGVLVSVKKGGTLIEHEDEDPEVRRLFVSECAKNGVTATLPT